MGHQQPDPSSAANHKAVPRWYLGALLSWGYAGERNQIGQACSGTAEAIITSLPPSSHLQLCRPLDE
jgi:hypothetical protein